MKKIIVLFLMFPVFMQLQAQSEDREAHRERIKALKTAYITQELNLSTKVAEKFWPIYNNYEAKRKDLHRREHVNMDLSNPECISEDQANGMLQEYLDVEREEYVIKKELFRELRKIISAQDIIKLHKLEDEFHKKLIKEYRAKKDRAKTQEE
ncbi:MAG: hypothetical protein RI572_01660 [Salegentibacter sp.]|uniref:hypothetical protein n=1 Tax=Salegentibacter sp. TaxID=1903072 RepID=UPI0028702A43|nr:hypothetical protein [Salegentibacter sp.]MDR9456090.1 hypothetical protein [Salegentibacter sp.]